MKKIEKFFDLHVTFVFSFSFLTASIFKRAAAAAPCMIFLDELQAVFAKSDGQDAGGHCSNQLLSQLLLEMDGLRFVYLCT